MAGAGQEGGPWTSNFGTWALHLASGGRAGAGGAWGIGAGYTAHLVFEPDTGIGVMLLRNYGSGATDLGRAAQELAWKLVGIRAGGG